MVYIQIPDKFTSRQLNEGGVEQALLPLNWNLTACQHPVFCCRLGVRYRGKINYAYLARQIRHELLHRNAVDFFQDSAKRVTGIDKGLKGLAEVNRINVPVNV
jgi:hypothetical protein